MSPDVLRGIAIGAAGVLTLCCLTAAALSVWFRQQR